MFQQAYMTLTEPQWKIQRVLRQRLALRKNRNWYNAKKFSFLYIEIILEKSGESSKVYIAVKVFLNLFALI